MTETTTTTADVEQLPVVEVHNCYTVYELNEDGDSVARPILSFSRPQDWAEPERWYYHYCKIEVPTPLNHYINHCHIWQEVERHPIEACKAIAATLFVILQPGKPVELCANTHLAEEDFWLDEWGEKPPIFYDETDDYSEEEF